MGPWRECRGCGRADELFRRPDIQLSRRRAGTVGCQLGANSMSIGIMHLGNYVAAVSSCHGPLPPGHNLIAV